MKKTGRIQVYEKGPLHFKKKITERVAPPLGGMRLVIILCEIRRSGGGQSSTCNLLSLAMGVGHYIIFLYVTLVF